MCIRDRIIDANAEQWDKNITTKIDVESFWNKVKEIRDDIEQNGVDSGTPPVFIDIETGDIITGGHRHDASSTLGIPGWMFVFVKCKNHWARKRFAKALNNERVFHSTNNDRDEVIEHIKYGIKHGEITCQQEIEDEVRLIANNSLSVTVQGTLVKEMVSYIASNGITTVKSVSYTHLTLPTKA